MAWNNELPLELQSECKNYRSDLQTLNELKVPRHIFDGMVPATQELHFRGHLRKCLCRSNIRTSIEYK